MPRRSTARKKERFLDGLERDMTVREAAAHAGVTRGTPYQWAREDDDFNRAWTAAREMRLDMLVDVATDDAMEGDRYLLRYLIDREDRRRAGTQAPTIGEIVIIDGAAIDEDGEVHDFISLE